MTRLLLLFAGVFAAASLLAAACVSALGLMWVTVASPQQNLSLPVPLAIARAAARFLPDDLLDPVDQRNLAAAIQAGGALAEALETVPDGFTLVEVEEPGRSVQIAREGADLVVRVDDVGQRVRVRTRLTVLTDAAGVCSPDQCDLKRLTRTVLRRAGQIQVEVRSDEAEVRIAGF